MPQNPAQLKEGELLLRVAELESEIKKLKERKKYGLVWEDRSEDVVLQCRENVPILQEYKAQKIVTDEATSANILIEGDNYHALSVLNYTHREAFDVIYADPPYNTGNKSWRYNNDYVEKDDDFKHSKWLSYIHKRLLLAKNLLTDSGILIFAIDDYEAHTLRLLLDEVMGEDNRLGTIAVVHNPRGRNDDQFFATQHEYMLVYAKDHSRAEIGNFELTEEDRNQYKKHDEISPYAETSFMRTGNNSNHHERPKLFYPIFFNPRTRKLSLKLEKGGIEILPINEAGEEKTWRWGKETFERLCDTDLFVKTVKGRDRIFKKRRLTVDTGKKPKSVWYNSRYDASTQGIMVLQDIFGRGNHFNYPKSLLLMEDILEITSKPDSLVLDFFAGSGTTGHAVLKLNKKDGGNRRFVLSTNNENKICEEVTYERLKRVIKGYTNSKDKNTVGLGGNLTYYKTALVSIDQLQKVSDEAKIKIAYQAGEMIAVRESTPDELEKNDWWQLFGGSGKIMAVYFKEDKARLSDLVKKLEKTGRPVVLYVFGWGKNEYKNEYGSGKIRVEDIPEPILEVYKELNRL
ncbi:MAG: site-specific DNA-methyltransferase [Patescibacteria group bacterium]|nr:MAG: site-specific DNA-methyltransferase [Patescibacteria group bacterium]